MPELIINDENYKQYLVGFRGYYGMWLSDEDRRTAKGFGDLGIPLIPEREWDEVIDMLEKSQATIRQLSLARGLECLDQGSSNYCWVNAPTHCCEIARLVETGRVFSYSPASAGAPIKGFRNVGGWGSQALDYFLEYGLNETVDWPANAIDRRYYTTENQQKKLAHKTLERYVLNSWEERGSCILAGIPTADGYNWWSHEVTGVGIVKGSHDLRIRNSWGMSWSDKGFALLSGSRKQADDSVAITSMVAL